MATFLVRVLRPGLVSLQRASRIKKHEMENIYMWFISKKSISNSLMSFKGGVHFSGSVWYGYNFGKQYTE